jgi:hypothetical protein
MVQHFLVSHMQSLYELMHWPSQGAPKILESHISNVIPCTMYEEESCGKEKKNLAFLKMKVQGLHLYAENI